MATNLALDDALIVEAQAIGGAATKKAAVTEALKEYIQRRKQVQIPRHGPSRAECYSVLLPYSAIDVLELGAEVY